VKAFLAKDLRGGIQDVVSVHSSPSLPNGR
jgi:hypothetical protein